MTDFPQRPGESPLAWLTRLTAADAATLTPAQQRARTAFLAEARRLCQHNRQQARWSRDAGARG